MLSFLDLPLPFASGGTGPRSQPTAPLSIGALIASMSESSKNMGSSDRLEEALIRLTNQNMYLGESVNSVTLKIDELIQRLGPALSTPSPTPPPLPPPFPIRAVTHKMRLDVPRFDGTEPLGWIFKINQFFEYHGTPEQDKLAIASFYMEAAPSHGSSG